jgi:hypothetical protein
LPLLLVAAFADSAAAAAGVGVDVHASHHLSQSSSAALLYPAVQL